MSPLGMTCLVLLALANVCLLVHDHKQEEAFLDGLNLSHLKDTFREQEVRVEMIPHLNDATLSNLGITTIGARFNVRAAARTFEYEEQEQEEHEVQVQEGQVQEGQVEQDQEQEQEQEEHEQEPEETQTNPDFTLLK